MSGDPTTPANNDSGNFACLLQKSADRYGSRPAIVHRGDVATFADIANRAGGIVVALTDAGVKQGDVCALLARRPADAASAFFAAIGIGAIAINLNELYRPRQIEYVLSHSGAKALLISREILDGLPRALVTDVRLLALDDIGSARAGFSPVALSGREPAQITYTSGSTGQPKGVLVSHDNLWAGVRIVAGYLGLKEQDRIASLLPFSFVYGFNQLTTSLHVGATLIVERSTLAQEVVETLRRERVTVLAAVPPLWQQLLGVSAFRDAPIETLRIATNAGGRLDRKSVV